MRAAEVGVTAGSCWWLGDFWSNVVLILLAAALPSGVGGKLQPVTEVAQPVTDVAAVSLRALIELL